MFHWSENAGGIVCFDRWCSCESGGADAPQNRPPAVPLVVHNPLLSIGLVRIIYR